MKLAIVGSQYLTPKQEVSVDFLVMLTLNFFADRYPQNKLSNPSGLVFVSGGCEGVDTIAESWADELGIPKDIKLPLKNTWDGEGGFKWRNKLIAEACDFLVCIRSNTSKTYGSGWTADEAERLGKTVRRVYV